jgi:hypothetical protein
MLLNDLVKYDCDTNRTPACQWVTFDSTVRDASRPTLLTSLDQLTYRT